MNPTVCAILLTADRPELTKKAIQSFRAQTYPHAHLLVWDSGESDEIEGCGCNPECFHVKDDDGRELTIGALRNRANAFRNPYHKPSDIIIHFDSDDWSHPNRIAEQVALLQASGADCVGYNSMLFWRTPRCRDCGDEANTNCGDDPMGDASAHRPIVPGEAWLYSNPRANYALGTSLCYWRKTWEAKPFEDIPKPGDREGEDGRFIRGLNVKAVSSIGELIRVVPGVCHSIGGDEPRMIARIHSGNTSDQYRDIAQSGNWKRVPEWDQRVRETMQ